MAIYSATVPTQPSKNPGVRLTMQRYLHAETR